MIKQVLSSQRRERKGQLYRSMAIAGVLALAAVPLAGVGTASAAVGGDSRSQAVDVNLNLLAAALPEPVPGLEVVLDAGSPLVVVPGTNGTADSTLNVAAVTPLASVATGAVSATATRSALDVRATSTVDSTSVILFGTELLSAGAISSSAVCSVDGTIDTVSDVVGLTVGGSVVDLSVTPTADVVVPVTVTGLANAGVRVQVSSPEDDATGVAQGLNVNLFLEAEIESTGTLVNLPVGSVVLAASSCVTPLADPAAPTASSITPATGPTSGSTADVIGTGFTPDTTVTVDGAPVDVVVNSDTSITVTFPATETPGVVDVVVTTPGGSSDPLVYEYVAPTITGLTPGTGPIDGGTPVTITGTGFLPGDTVTFDGVPATDVVVVSPTTITAVTPANAAGPATVTVVTAGADAVMEPGFVYLADANAPAALTISPTSGPTSGGTLVTITGVNFTPDSTVTFGANEGLIVSTTPTQITVTSPGAGSAGIVDVVVTSSGVDSNGLEFEYVAPTITAVSPSSGAVGGGQPVTITGTGFLPGSTSVLFGDTQAQVVSVTPDSVSVITPAGTAGPVDVTVSLPGVDAVATQAYEYVVPSAAPAEISSITPAVGPTGGGQEVRLTGSGFTPDTQVIFGGVVSPSVNVISPTELLAITPANTPGGVDVYVYGPGGSSPALDYMYVEPIISTVTPNTGSTEGGTTVTVEGSGFVPGATVTVGGNPATGVTVVDGGTITFVTPAGPAGFADVVVALPNGQVLTAPGVFRYEAPVVVAPVVTPPPVVNRPIATVVDANNGRNTMPARGTDDGLASTGAPVALYAMGSLGLVTLGAFMIIGAARKSKSA